MPRKINLTKEFGIFLVLIVILSNLVFAFGVTSSYWKGNPLIIYPGATETVSVGLQNMAEGAQDETIRVSITKGSEIATTEAKDYLVKAGTKDTAVPITIQIPSDVAANTTYQVTVSSKAVNIQQGGGVTLGTAFDTTFDVLVVAKPTTTTKGVIGGIEKPTLVLIGVIIAIIILVIIILIVLRRKKR